MFSETYLIVNPSTDHPFIIGHRSTTHHTQTHTDIHRTNRLLSLSRVGPPYSSTSSPLSISTPQNRLL